ncbi:MAG: CDP-glucose 4,6-dehydratase [Ginsengibacter sp.]
MDQLVGEQILGNFYKGAKVFITGHTGFKGAWMVYVLQKAGAILKGYSLAPDTEPSLYNNIQYGVDIQSVFADINDAKKLRDEILSFQPDFVFHLAAQALVRRSYEAPVETFATNVIGTANVLEALTLLERKCTAICITTDKVYENRESLHPYDESDRLGGYDPYSASKACAEMVIKCYGQSFFNTGKFNIHGKAIASVRSGNIIGGGDWCGDRLLPDIIRSLANNEEIIIRNPSSIRPWQHVLDPVHGYLQLGARLSKEPEKYSGAWNFGPDTANDVTVLDIAEKAIGIWGTGRIDIQTDPNAPHEAGLLKLDISKAMKELKWKPVFDTWEAVSRTVNWYKSYYAGADSYKLMDADISHYETLLRN